MSLIIGAGFLVIVGAAAVYLLRTFREYKKKRDERRTVDATLNPPEAVIARALGDAKRQLPPAEYKKFEAAVFAEIEKANQRHSKRSVTTKI